MVKILTVAGSIGCLVMAGSALSILPREAAPLSVPPVRSAEYFPYMSAENATFGPSLYSRRRVLRDCDDGIRRVQSFPQLLPDAERAKFLDHCRQLAQEAIDKAPVDAYPWLVQMRLYSGNENIAAFNNAYIEAFRRSPNEYSYVMARVIMAESDLKLLDSQSMAALEADYLTIGQTRLGQAWLAQNYATRPEFRERITPLIEKLPSKAQRDFLFKVKTEMNSLNR